MPKLPQYLKRNITLLDVHSHVGVDPLLYLSHSFPFCQNLRDAFEQNRDAGVSHAVVFPMSTSLGYDLTALRKGRVVLTHKPAEIPFVFENEQMLRQLYEIFPAYKSMFIPFVIIDPLREAPRQVRALEKLLGRYPFYGLKVMPRATQARLSSLGREGRSFLEFAHTHDFPIITHSSVVRLDPYSQIDDLFKLARAHPALRFCAAHFCCFHLRRFQEADRMENVWVDSAAMSIGCDLVLKKAPVYVYGKEQVPANYRQPSRVFAELARRFPDTLMWGSDNPFHTWISASRLPSGKIFRLRLWGSMTREKKLLQFVEKNLRRKVSVQNALRFIEG